MAATYLGEQTPPSELRDRIREVIVYGNLPVVKYEWTREAYKDLSSMGRPFVEPATKVVSYREMNPSELADAIEEVVISLSCVPGKIKEMLAPVDVKDRHHTYCTTPKLSLKQQRCMRCQGCINYEMIINKVRGHSAL